MRYVKPSLPRAEMHRVPGGVEVSIPSRRPVVAVLFLTLWLALWLIGEVSEIERLIVPSGVHADKGDVAGDLAGLAWLVLWTLLGAIAFFSLLWHIGGRETLSIDNDALILRRATFGLGFSRHFQLSAVKDFRAVDIDVAAPRRRDPFGWQSGHLAFDYGASTVRFGAGVDLAEAKSLVERILAAKPAVAPQ